MSDQSPDADLKCSHCGGPVNYFKQCLFEIWSGRLQH